MNNHVIYLSNNKAVCEKPTMLGRDKILINYVDGESTCPICMNLIMAHGEKHDKYDLIISLPENLKNSRKPVPYHWREFQHGAYIMLMVLAAIAILIYFINIGR